MWVRGREIDLLPRFALVLATVALILHMLCLFAGAKPNFLGSYPTLTVDTTQFAYDFVDAISSNTDTDVSELLAALPPQTQDAFASAYGTESRRLGLYDFYDLHVLTWCDGYYTPAPNISITTVPPPGAKRDVTECSKLRGALDVTIQQIILSQVYTLNNLSETLSGFSMTDDQIASVAVWPSDVDSALHTFQNVQKTTFYFYVIDIIIIFIAILISILSLDRARASAFFSYIFMSFAAFMSLLTSVMVTIAAYVARNEVNSHAGNLGITAIMGSKFFILTWVATVVIDLASALWALEFIKRLLCCGWCRRGRHEYKQAYSPWEQQADMYTPVRVSAPTTPQRVRAMSETTRAPLTRYNDDRARYPQSPRDEYDNGYGRR